jgi:hypothetical protein
VAVARAARLAKTTEVDVDGAIWFPGDPDIVTVIARDASTVDDGAFVTLASLRLSSDWGGLFLIFRKVAGILV